jgi:hypothetical protein
MNFLKEDLLKGLRDIGFKSPRGQLKNMTKSELLCIVASTDGALDACREAYTVRNAPGYLPPGIYTGATFYVRTGKQICFYRATRVAECSLVCDVFRTQRIHCGDSDWLRPIVTGETCILDFSLLRDSVYGVHEGGAFRVNDE